LDVEPLPVHRLLEFTRLSDRELRAFHQAQSHRISVDRKKLIRAEGDPVEEIYFVIDGWAASYMDLPNGRRQIVKVHLPGDMMGAPSMALERAADSFVALTPMQLAVFPLEAIASLFEDEPRLALTLFLCAQQERVALMDRIASIGRTSAIQRVAAFFLQLHRRLKAIDPGMDNSFELPLTQIELSQVIGLTTVHANRTLREMDRLGIVYRYRSKITLVDINALSELAGLPERRYVRDPAWFLGARPDTPKPHLVKSA
jgi:CRP/FNR family transcriptional regulator